MSGAVESANGLVYIPSFRDNGEFPKRIWASLNGEVVGYVRERTCIREKHGTKMDGSPKLRCSLCGYGIGDKRWNYCPSCGARVEGAE